MSLWGLVLIASILAWIQIFLLGAAAGGLLVINLLIIFVIIVAFQRSLLIGLATALVAGFWLDVASSTQFGIRMVFFAALVGSVALLQRWGIIIERRWSFALVVALASLLYGMWLLAWTWIDVGSLVWAKQLLVIWLVEAAVCAFLGALMYKRLLSVSRGSRYA
jgi:hypothetical protein